MQYTIFSDPFVHTYIPERDAGVHIVKCHVHISHTQWLYIKLLGPVWLAAGRETQEINNSLSALFVNTTMESSGSEQPIMLSVVALLLYRSVTALVCSFPQSQELCQHCQNTRQCASGKVKEITPVVCGTNVNWTILSSVEPVLNTNDLKKTLTQQGKRAGVYVGIDTDIYISADFDRTRPWSNVSYHWKSF